MSMDAAMQPKTHIVMQTARKHGLAIRNAKPVQPPKDYWRGLPYRKEHTT